MASPPRPFQLVRSADQWLRSVHHDTSLDMEGGVVSLAFTVPERLDVPGAAPVAAGLAFDQECRLYHSSPSRGGIDRLLWAAELVGQVPEPLLPARTPVTRPGEFSMAPGGASPALDLPTALAVDSGDRLFVCETGARRLLVYDLWSRHLVRRLPIAGRPLDLAVDTDGAGVFLLVGGPPTPRLLRLEARRDPVAVAVPAPALVDPIRFAIAQSGTRWMLCRAMGGTTATVIPLDDPASAFVVDRATDIEFDGGGVLVVARHPGEDFRRFRLSAGTREELPPLAARGYDGAGIVRTPDGRIGYWTGTSFRHALAARVTYAATGEVISFRLDAGEFQTQWGRLFLDACIPVGTEIRVHCVATDEPPATGTISWHPPDNIPSAVIRHPQLTPPLLPAALYQPATDLLHRRETGRELPWARFGEDDRFETYEAPILAPPGRYLWVTLGLSGDTQRSPRVRSLRAEHPGHDYLRRLPRTFSRDDSAASFLQRYLALFDGTLGELDARAAARFALVDPRSAPPELLPWLGSFLGVLFDERWPVDKRRTLIEEAIFLFRFRGTITGLRRYIEIYLGAPVHLLEHWRLRGLGGPVVGDSGTGAPISSRSVLGSGFRVGGAVGTDPDQPQALAGVDLGDAFRTHAHRFTVLAHANLDEEQRAVIAFILDQHRPAHTIFDLCSVGAGMRVGRGPMVGLSTVIGQTGGFRGAQLGAWPLGRDGLLGRPRAGFVPGSTRLGEDSRVG